MKYKLINITTKVETICDKVVIDDFDYYVVDKTLTEEDFRGNTSYLSITQKRIIATNNPNNDLPNIVIPKVVDEATTFANEIYAGQGDYYESGIQVGRIEGYNKAKETYKFTEQDMIEFTNYAKSYKSSSIVKKAFEIWKSQQPITIYFE